MSVSVDNKIIVCFKWVQLTIALTLLTWNNVLLVIFCSCFHSFLYNGKYVVAFGFFVVVFFWGGGLFLFFANSVILITVSTAVYEIELKKSGNFIF